MGSVARNGEGPTEYIGVDTGFQYLKKGRESKTGPLAGMGLRMWIRQWLAY